MKKQIINSTYFLLGTNKDGEKVYLKKATFDCNWYWGIGYINTFNHNYTDITSHFHFDTSISTWDEFNDYFDETVLTQSEIWQLLELMNTLYTLRKMSDTIYQGGSHYTTNDVEKELFKEYQSTYDKINNETIPTLLDEVYKLLGGEE